VYDHTHCEGLRIHGRAEEWDVREDGPGEVGWDGR
jgi:hypothetical protein